jgi:outer membrane usher protein
VSYQLVTSYRRRCFQRIAGYLHIIVLQALLWPLNGRAEEFFPTELLELNELGMGEIDLSSYQRNGAQIPGTYRVDIIVSDRFIESMDIAFFSDRDEEGRERLQPCLSIDTMERLKIKTAAFAKLRTDGDCVNLAAIPQAGAEFDFERQRLLLSIPQAALYAEAKGYVAQERWDDGIIAGIINYSYSGSQTRLDKGDDRNNSDHYINLRPGLNIGAWRIRNYSTWNKNDRNSGKWDSIYTYVQRAVPTLKGQLVLGDGNSPSDIFDSVAFRGVQLASDDDMMPDSLKGYAPSVTGIARTNAQVIIKQNGYTIYQTYVAPGAFEINDMYPTGGSGDLEVTVKEADGSERTFSVPFASLPILQRSGRFKYSVSGGEYRAYDSDIDKSYFGQFTAIYGLPGDMSVYGGAQLAEKSRYQSAAAGIGKNLGVIGAISADVTQSWSKDHNDSRQNGQSWQVRYGKNLLDSGTNITIAGYRYSTEGFYTLSEALDSYIDGGHRQENQERRRNRTELTLNQRLWWENAGTLSVYLVNEDYWKSDRRSQSIGLNYSGYWKGVSYGANYTYHRNRVSGAGDKFYEKDQILSLNLSIPLGSLMPNSWVNYSFMNNRDGRTTHSVGVNGTLLANDNLYWSALQSHGNKGQGAASNLNLDYRGSYGQLNTGYAYNKTQRRLNYGLQGGIVLHRDGITLGQQLSDTAVLVKAPGAEGVEITGQPGVATDFRGYTIVPYASPYRENVVSLNTENMPDSVDFTQASQTVVPTRGAVVRASFDASIGSRALVTLMQSNGLAVPFGARVTMATPDKRQDAIVGDNGQVYLSGLTPSGRLSVIWGKSDAQRCQANYVLPEQAPMGGIRVLEAQCH